jgi:hypothetical protein
MVLVATKVEPQLEVLQPLMPKLVVVAAVQEVTALMHKLPDLLLTVVVVA